MADKNKPESVEEVVEEVLRTLDGLAKADPPTDPDERSQGSGEPTEDPAASASAPPEGAASPQAEESLEEIYGSMSPEELEEHMEALQKVMAAKAGQGPEASPAPSPPPMAPPPASASAPMMRSEQPMAKSEGQRGHFHPEDGPCATCDERAREQAERQRVEDLAKSQGETQEKMARLAKGVVALMKLGLGQQPKPLRKSIENISELAGSRPAPAPKAPDVAKMDPKQVAAILMEKVPTLAKHERDKVTAYYEGRIPASGIAHLLSA